MGPDGVPNGVARRGGQTGVARWGWPDGVAKRGRTGCPTGLEGVPDGVPDGVKWGPDRARRSAQRAKRGGGRKDYLLLKEKMTCSVYVSCKSSSTSDVSDAG
jgi:hypothetical protein